MSTPNDPQSVVAAAEDAFTKFIADVLRVVNDITNGAVDGKVDVSGLAPLTQAAEDAQAKLDAADPAQVQPDPSQNI
jgi:hypothetical protein